MQRTRYVLLLLSLACIPGAFGAAAPVSTEVPAQIEGRIIFVKARVNGAEPMTFILDSGASETIVTPPAARKLGIRAAGPAGIKTGKAKSISVGKATVRNLSVFVFDPPQALSLRLDKGINYSGILGYTFLSKFVMTIDYEKSRVKFEPVSTLARSPRAGPGAAGSHVIPFQVKNRMIHVKGSINGIGPLVFLVDTGAAEFLLLPKVAEKLNIKQVPHPDIESVGLATIDKVELGGAVVTDIPAIIHTLPQDNKSTHSYHGIIGYPFLSKFKVTINYAKNVLILTPGKTEDESKE